MLKRKLKQLVTMMCATACVVTAVPVMDVSARTYTAEELYNTATINDAPDFEAKYCIGAENCTNEAYSFGSFPASLKDVTVSIENDRTGGINVRWFACLYSVKIERYDYATKQWELLGYKNDDELSAYKEYMVDMAAGYTYLPYDAFSNVDNYKIFNDCCIYEDDAVQLNHTYKYRITPFNIYPESRAEAVALGKEAEYDKIVSKYEANGYKVVEENGYSVVFYPSHTTKKMKNTLEAPYMSVKETKYCKQCEKLGLESHIAYLTTASYGSNKCSLHKTYKHQITFDIEWQDVDGYEIYYSNYSDTGFKKWKTVKPKAISHSWTAFPARTQGQDGLISTTFLLHTKLANGKYFYKIRSYVVVDGKKVYSEFSPVTSTYDYMVHDDLDIREVVIATAGDNAALIQATEEYNQLNRLMNERGYLWQKYSAGKISKTRFLKGVKTLRPDSEYGVYKATVKTLNLKNVQKTVLGIKDKIKNKIWKKHPELGYVCFYTVHVDYKKSKKVYEISVMYSASVD